MKNVMEQTISLLEKVVDRQFGGNASDAARFLDLDVKSNILSKWIKGERSPTLAKIAPVYEKLGVTLNIPGEELIAYDIIPKYAAKAGAGSSFETSEEVEGFYAFRRDWLQKLNIQAKNAKLIDVVGDSMEPTLREGDTLLVDTGDKEIVDGRIYMVTLGDELLVKRVQKTFDGLDLLSDNKSKFPSPSHVAQEDRDKLCVHGRVRWVGKEL